MIEMHNDETKVNGTPIKGVSLFMIIAGGQMQPLGDDDRERMRNIKPGVPFEVTVKQHRNVTRHRHFFAMLNTVLKNWPDYRGACPFNTVEDLLDALKYELGYFENFKNLEGRPFRKLKSIAWEKCDNVEFTERIWNPAVTVMAGILGITSDELVTNTRLI